MNKDKIKQDENFLCGLEMPDYNFFVYLLYTGGPRVQYCAFLGDTILFEGKDFKPSPLRDIDSLESVIDLLGFLTVKEGDTDKEYFAKYNEDQLNWCRSFDCERLGGLVMDFYNAGEKQYYRQAKRYFKKHFIEL